MKFLADLFPILLFFIAYKFYGIYTATAVAIAASFIQTAYYWWRNGKPEKVHLITFAMLAVFGGLTLFLQDPVFIQWKPTIINWLFGLVFIGSLYIGKKPIIKRMMENAMQLPENIWFKLSFAWGFFFIFLGCLNLYVAFNYDEATWVNFKLFGLTGLLFVFVIAQSLFLSKYMQDPETNEAP